MEENEIMTSGSEAEGSAPQEPSLEPRQEAPEEESARQQAAQPESARQAPGDPPQRPAQTPEENARYAQIRRKAEEQARAEYERKQAAQDARMQELFGKYGVRTVEEYLDRYEAQQRKATEKQLSDAGIDLNAVMKSLQNTPEIRRLRESAARLMGMEEERREEEALAQIKKLDPSVTDWRDIAAKDPDRVYYDLVFNRHMDEVSAFKVAFFDRLVDARAQASRQAAVNAARSKSHLAPVKGQAQGGLEMTDAELEEWAAYGFKPSDAKKYKAKFAKER